MTSIVSILTPDYVMQVSDRRLSDGNQAFDRPISILDDDSNKALVLDGRFSFAFTGLARFRKRSSEEVLADIWSSDKVDQNNEAQRILDSAERLSFEMKQIFWPAKLKRLAYMGVGWAQFGTTLREPVYLALSNFHYQGGVQDKAKDDFSAYCVRLKQNEHFGIYQAGVPIPSLIWKSFSRLARKLAAKNVYPSAMLNLVVSFMQFTSQNDARVGSRLMVTCIPNTAANGKDLEVHMLNGLPDLEIIRFCYLDGFEFAYPQKGPIFSHPGIMLSGFSSTGPSTGIMIPLPGSPLY